MEQQTDNDPCVINEGDQVVFHREGWSRVLQIRQNRQIYLDKTKLNADALIGQPYGSTFEVDRGKLTKVETVDTLQLPISETSSGPVADNRNLLDLDSNQKMSKDDIMKMKDEGMTGQKIIEELVENSETFKSKTEYSQAKYLKKKKKKHISVFTVLRPTPRLVMEIFSKEPAKICYLRPDSMSQLLSYSNAMHGSRVAVVETCQGLVLSCLLQRVGAAGKIVQLIPNSTNAVCRQVMDYLGFAKFTENVYTYPMDELASLKHGGDSSSKVLPEATPSEKSLNKDSSNEPMEPGNESAKQGPGDAELEPESPATTSNGCRGAEGTQDQGVGVKPETDGAGDRTGSGEVEGAATKLEAEGDTGEKRQLGPNRELQRQRRAQRQREAGEIIKQKQLDSLVIACKYNPTPILLTMLEFLHPSTSIVVFCPHLEPLVECYSRVKESRSGVQLKLSETWFREYQILPQRTHPMINMSGTGGYLLTFTTVQTS